MTYKLIYHADVKKIDLAKIDNKNKAMIKRAIEERLATQPEIYGKPLQRSLKGYWKLRVGDYRAIFKISEYDIFILGIMDRKNIYSQIKKRKIGNEST
jgi:mRNA interferase RelE/StbE